MPLANHAGWFRTFGCYDVINVGNSMILDEHGSYIVSGYTGCSSRPDIYILKVNENGNLVWSHNYGLNGWLLAEKSTCIRATSDHGFILTGYVEFATNKLLLLKTDSTGDSLWFKFIGDNERDFYGNSLITTSDGSYIVTGSVDSDSSYGTDVLLVKTDSIGDTLWIKKFNRGNDRHNIGRDINCTPDNGYIICASSHILFNTDIWLIKTDSSGDSVWTKIIGGAWIDEGYSLTPTDDSGFIISGTTNSYLDDQGEGYDVYVIKTDQNGNIKWSQVYLDQGEDIGYCISCCSNGDYIITGADGLPNSIYHDIFLLRIDSFGRIIWKRNYGDSLDNVAKSVIQLPDGGFVVTGYCYGGYEFGCFDYSKLFLLKTDSLGVAVEENIISSPQQNCFAVTTRGNLRTRISFSLTQAGQVSVDVYDLSGRNVSSPVEGYYPAGEHCIYWQAPLPGIYFFRISSDQLNKTVKTAVLR